MNDFEEKDQTMKFDAVKDAPQPPKPQRNRSQNDEFTAARNGRGYEIYHKKERGNGALIAVACILAVLLIATIAVAIVILKADKEAPQMQNDGAIVKENDEDVSEEEEIPEIQNKIISCDLVFHPETIEEEDGAYTIKADFFDQKMNLFESREVIINKETDIRQDGERLAVEGFIYIIENSGGDQTIFKGEVREEDGAVVAISFESLPEEVETEEAEEETVPEENSEDDVTEDLGI